MADSRYHTFVVSEKKITATGFRRSAFGRTAAGKFKSYEPSPFAVLTVGLYQTLRVKACDMKIVIPGRLSDSGFEFEFPTWADAAQDLCDRWRGIQWPDQS